MTITSTTRSSLEPGAATAAPGSPGPAAHAGSPTVALAGFQVTRVVFGAARLTPQDGWGVPADPGASRALLRVALDSGINHVDTADALGIGVSESLIGETIRPSEDVLVSTKVGMLRPGPRSWGVLGHPDYLRQQVHGSLQRLRRERIDLLYLHRIDPNYPLADQLGALQELRDAGLVGHLGVSEPTLEQLGEVLALEPALAAVQSLYNVAETRNASVARELAARGIPFVAYWPLVGRGLLPERRASLFAQLGDLAGPLGLTATQLTLAWIFTTQPHALAVVGSRSATHLGENVRAAGIALDDCTLTRVSEIVAGVLAGTTFDPRHPQEEEQ